MKDTKRIALVLSSILLFLGICTMYITAYSSFVFVKSQNEQAGTEVYRKLSTVSTYEKTCTTRMIYGSRSSLPGGNRSLFRNVIQELRLLDLENKVPVNQLFYYTTVSMFFFTSV